MKKRKLLLAIAGGAACAAFNAWAAWDSITHHGGRLVYPMDSYSFQPSDIPMIAAVALDILDVSFLVVSLILSISAQRKQTEAANRTRKLNPKLGFLGILGLAGFLGFYTYVNYDQYTAFCFFTFFGFFGFFYEGKMSNTYRDERFRENVLRAERDACRTGIIILFFLLVIAGQSRAPASFVLPALLIGISLDLALTVFLSAYLLYRYDHDDALELEDE